VVLANLGYFERSLVQLSKFLLSSPYTRYALLVYLAVVHIFASSAVLSVLDPEALATLEANFELGSPSVA